MNQEKEIRWVGSSYQDILKFPAEPRKEAGFQLGKVQAGLEPDDWKPFNEVGVGTKEILISKMLQLAPSYWHGCQYPVTWM